MSAAAAVTEKRKLQELPELPYLRWGIGAGALGAFIVAAFFALLDLAAGRPLATPITLGSTLFMGDPTPQEPFSVLAAMVVGYTLVHGAIFVGLATVTSSLVLGAERRPPRPLWLGALLSVAFFVGLLVLSGGFGFLTGKSLWAVVGVGRFALANGLASVAMGALLAYAFRTRWKPPVDERRVAARAAHASAPQRPEHLRSARSR
jgi:hypothetical protein